MQLDFNSRRWGPEAELLIVSSPSLLSDGKKIHPERREWPHRPMIAVSPRDLYPLQTRHVIILIVAPRFCGGTTFSRSQRLFNKHRSNNFQTVKLSPWYVPSKLIVHISDANGREKYIAAERVRQSPRDYSSILVSLTFVIGISSAGRSSMASGTLHSEEIRPKFQIG
jgi:hypothetical protein